MRDHHALHAVPIPTIRLSVLATLLCALTAGCGDCGSGASDGVGPGGAPDPALQARPRPGRNTTDALAPPAHEEITPLELPTTGRWAPPSGSLLPGHGFELESNVGLPDRCGGVSWRYDRIDTGEQSRDDMLAERTQHVTLTRADEVSALLGAHISATVPVSAEVWRAGMGVDIEAVTAEAIQRGGEQPEVFVLLFRFPMLWASASQGGPDSCSIPEALREADAETFHARCGSHYIQRAAVGLVGAVVVDLSAASPTTRREVTTHGANLLATSPAALDALAAHLSDDPLTARVALPPGWYEELGLDAEQPIALSEAIRKIRDARYKLFSEVSLEANDPRFTIPLVLEIAPYWAASETGCVPRATEGRTACFNERRQAANLLMRPANLGALGEAMRVSWLSDHPERVRIDNVLTWGGAQRRAEALRDCASLDGGQLARWRCLAQTPDTGDACHTCPVTPERCDPLLSPLSTRAMMRVQPERSLTRPAQVFEARGDQTVEGPRVDEALCVLSKVSGGFRGAGEQLRVVRGAGEDARWKLITTSGRRREEEHVHATMTCVPREAFLGADGPAVWLGEREIVMRAQDDPEEVITLEQQTGRLHLVQGVGGSLDGSAEGVHLIGERGYLYSKQGYLTATLLSTGVQPAPGANIFTSMLTRGDDFAIDRLEDGAWIDHRVQRRRRLVHADEGLCTLQTVQGMFTSNREVASLEIDAGGYWTLTLTSGCATRSKESVCDTIYPVRANVSCIAYDQRH